MSSGILSKEEKKLLDLLRPKVNDKNDEGLMVIMILAGREHNVTDDFIGILEKNPEMSIQEFTSEGLKLLPPIQFVDDDDDDE